MKNFFKNNSSILVLIIIIVGGFFYALKVDSRILIPRIGQTDLQCAGVAVPSEIQYSEGDLFCSCIRLSNHQTIKERYEYCVNKFAKNTN
ncbi:hypothetical protein F909_02234 [Acinetobacter sp. ANC 3929]|nr:hypothetical protein F909_02234 [Acinetobacter sp. ANC 3929]